MAPSGLLLHHTLRNRTKLRHLRQRAISSRKIPSPLENIPSWSATPNRHPYRPLQPTILEGTSKYQLTNRMRVSRTPRVQFCTQTCSREQECVSRCTFSKTRLRHW